jgi:hypothetical protein
MLYVQVQIFFAVEYTYYTKLCIILNKMKKDNNLYNLEKK